MLTSCWSVKGGSGTTVVAASLAVLASRGEAGVTLVDLTGDGPAVLGIAEPTGPGLAEWLASEARAAESLARIAVPVVPGLALVHCGQQPEPAVGDPAGVVACLRALGGPVVVDVGRPHSALARELVQAATSSLLVLRPCYLAVRRAAACDLRPHGLVLVREPGRALGAKDVAEVLGLPVLAEVDVDPVIARAVDAGLLAGRLPRLLERGLRSAA